MSAIPGSNSEFADSSIKSRPNQLRHPRPRERDARAIAAIAGGPIVPVMPGLRPAVLVVLVVQALVGVVEHLLCQLPRPPALIFGWGPFPPLGIDGAGAAVAIYYVAAAAVLTAYLLSGRAAVRLLVARIESRLVSAIMRVGGLSAIGTIQANLTVALVTCAVGIYGAPVIAGYGIASRLDYLLIPLLFGFGTAAVTMVGANVGAGNAARARRIAWIGAAIGGGATGAIGLVAAIFPNLWSGIFTADGAFSPLLADAA
jgi:Na+-driven multidrug efflux pump